MGKNTFLRIKKAIPSKDIKRKIIRAEAVFGRIGLICGEKLYKVDALAFADRFGITGVKGSYEVIKRQAVL